MKRVVFLLLGILLAGLVTLSACARPAPAPSPKPPATAVATSPTAKPAAPPAPASKPSPAAAVYPEKNITWVLPVPPGGGTDIPSRTIAQVMPKYLPAKTVFVMDNQPVPATILGLTIVNRSKPDGYTVGSVIYDSALIIQLTDKVEYDMRKFTLIGSLTKSDKMLFARANYPYNTLQEIAKSKEKVRFVTLPGTFNMMNAVIAKEAGFDFTLITGYLGTADVLLGLVRGDGDLATVPYISGAPYLKDGRLKAIFSLTEERIVPNVPSARDTGIPGVAELGKYGASTVVMFGPTGMPANIAGTLSEALRKSLADETIIEWAKKSNYTLAWQNPAQAAQSIAQSYDVFNRYAVYLK